MIVNNKHTDLLNQLNHIIHPWRKFLIAIDGHMGTGKSGLSRYLSLELDMPSVETDMLINLSEEQPNYRLNDLKSLVMARHNQNWPVIVEGVFLLDTLNKLNIDPDYLIFMTHKKERSEKDLRNYFEEYKPRMKAHYIFDTTDFIYL
ncbi:MAG: hypothetical protein JAY90_07210 [Candidatus Thiodiazotropha lotti]|nr:hypothetical protein [Candidatus Thiodiazotropha lotti]ODB94863.1 hypothetical protein A3197_19205 [Candidatus Thiodiazotropha endoloripes]